MIKGFEIKGLKLNSEIGNEYYSGNIYYQNKKVGTFSECPRGGSMNFIIDRPYREIMMNYMKESQPDNNFHHNIDSFIDLLITNSLRIKGMKKMMKKGFTCFIEFKEHELSMDINTVYFTNIERLEHYYQKFNKSLIHTRINSIDELNII